MVDVCMREHDSIEVCDRYWKTAVFLGRLVTPSLKHPTVERDRMTIDVQEMTRPRDFAGRANEGYFQTINLLLQHRAETES